MEGWGWTQPMPPWTVRPAYTDPPVNFQAWVEELGQRAYDPNPASATMGWVLYSAFCQQWLAITLAILIGRP